MRRSSTQDPAGGTDSSGNGYIWTSAKGKVTIGFDATPDAFQYMKEGKLGATIDQFPGRQAGEALKYLVDYVQNKKKPAKQVYYINPEAVTKAP